MQNISMSFLRPFCRYDLFEMYVDEKEECQAHFKPSMLAMLSIFWISLISLRLCIFPAVDRAGQHIATEGPGVWN